MSKNILFLVGNEYHLYSAICMYYKYFNSTEYNFKLLITKRPKNNRIGTDYDLPFEYFIFDDYLNYNDFKSTNRYPNYEKELNGIFKTVDELYIYFDFTFLSSLIINWVKKNPEAKVIMVQEGVAGYFKYRMPLFKIVKALIPFIYLKYFKRIKNIDFVYQWGFSSKVDILKMFHPEEVKIKTKAKVEKLDLDISSETLKKIKKIYKCQYALEPTKRYVLYLPIGEARGSAEAKIKELSVIEKLIKHSKINGYIFLIKIKAGLSSSFYSHLITDDIILIEEKIPAEILISDIQNSIIISAFSSAALHNVNNNQYYWVFPLLKFQTNLRPPTHSILLVEDESDLIKLIN